MTVLKQTLATALGSLWICDIYFAYDALSEWLGGQGALAAALGYAAGTPPPRPRKPPEELVEWRGL